MVQKQSELTKDSFLLTVSENIYLKVHMLVFVSTRWSIDSLISSLHVLSNFPTSYILSYTRQFQHSRTPFPETLNAVM